MGDFDKTFEKAEQGYLEGNPLSPRELKRMEKALRSSRLRSRCIACGALLRDPNTEPQLRARARNILLRLCKQLQDEAEKSELSITLLLIPFEELQTASARFFIKGLLRSSRFTLRSNALALLERFACRGDEEALDLIRRTTFDGDETVRKSALAKVKRLSAR